MNPGIIVAMAESLYRNIREYKLRKNTLHRSCKRCGFTDYHKFIRLDSGIIPISTKKVFECKNCSSEMLEDGTIITTLWDRIEAFVKAGDLKDALWELEILLKTNQNIAAKDREEIIRLMNELNDLKADKDLLKKRIRELIDRIKTPTEK